MSAPKSSRAYGKRFSDTSVPVARSKAQVEGVLERYGAEAWQFTTSPGRVQLRFRKDGRNYVFSLPQYDDDAAESRRVLRVLFWYLDGLLAAQETGIFDPVRALLPYLEVAPDLTLAEALDDPVRVQAITGVLGGPLALMEGSD